MTPFAALENVEKSAGFNLAAGVSKGLRWAGNALGRSGNAAKQVARKGVFNELGGSKAITNQADRLAMRDLTAGAAKGVGNKRIGLGNAVSGAAEKINNSPGLQKAINYGGGAAAIGGGMYGANQMGQASGYEAGANAGLDAGMTAGMESAMASQAQNQPGYLGGLWNAVKGQPSGGVNPAVAFGDLSNRRGEMLNQLLMSRS